MIVFGASEVGRFTDFLKDFRGKKSDDIMEVLPEKFDNFFVVHLKAN